MTTEERVDVDSPSGSAGGEGGRHFLRTIIADDLASGKHTGVVTRFPPEPNGYLHIGHAKSICLNFGLAGENQGRCHLRFDDTNPVKEDTEYVDSIQHDVKWLGFDWNEHLYFASDYFEKLYGFAVQLIKERKAYVCSLNEAEIREYRGTVTEAGRASPYRERSVEENLDLFARMRAGEFEDGAHVVRAKIDMGASNMKMRDPLLYRIRHAHHHRTGDDWCIYPMYDFAHCLSDSLEEITHSICTLEFENNRELYDWILQELRVPCQPQQIEFARLGLTYTVMSKRKLLQLVEEGVVSGWDDPRMPTIAGMRRRGYRPEAIRDFCERIGVAKANSMVDVAQLEYSVRDDLNHHAPRVMAVLDPLKVVITNQPEGETLQLDAPYFPHDIPKDGERKLPFGREIWIERSDFMMEPSKKYHRLAPGREVRLRHAYVIRCDEVVSDEGGNITELRCSLDPDTLGKNPTDRKVKGTIHWVSAEHAHPATIRLYDRLFESEKPDAEEGDFKDYLNPDSLTVVQAWVEPSLADADSTAHVQFERQGYFCVDSVDSKADALVFNRTVPLRDSWAKQKEDKAPESKPVPDKPAAKKSAKAAKEPVAPKERSAEDAAKIAALVNEFGLGEADAETLTQDAAITTFFRAACEAHTHAKAVANWFINELMRELKEQSVTELKVDGPAVGNLVKLIDDGVISGKIAKKVFGEMLASGKSADVIVEEKGLKQLTDPGEVQPLVDSVLAANGEAVEQYHAGKQNRMGFLVGQVIKASGGRANPKLVNELLRKSLINSSS